MEKGVEAAHVARFTKDQFIKAQWMGGTKLWPGIILKVNGDGTYDIKYKDNEVEEAVDEELIKADISKSNNRLLEFPVEALLGKRLLRKKWKGWSSMVKKQYLVKWQGYDKASENTWEIVEAQEHIDVVAPEIAKLEATFTPGSGFDLIGKEVLVKFDTGRGQDDLDDFIGTVMEWKDKELNDDGNAVNYMVEWDDEETADLTELGPENTDDWYILGKSLIKLRLLE